MRAATAAADTNAARPQPGQMHMEMDVNGTKTMMNQAAQNVGGHCDYEGTLAKDMCCHCKMWESPVPDFEKHEDYGCRNNRGGKGSEGNEYDFFHDVSREWCYEECLGRGSDCYGFEYRYYSPDNNNDKCEIWKKPIVYVESVHGLDCYIKS